MFLKSTYNNRASLFLISYIFIYKHFTQVRQSIIHIDIQSAVECV
jgi:hypothetical protein